MDTIADTKQELEKVLGQRLTAGNHYLTLPVGELERTYMVHVPPGYDESKRLPVVLFYHGGGGNAKAALRQTRWDQKADQEGFLVVFPEATPGDLTQSAHFRRNPRFWNDGSKRGIIGKLNRDDIGFTEALLDRLEEMFPVDTQRIFVTGFSNGAAMSYRVGVEFSHRVAAVANVAGYFRVMDPQPTRPLSLLAMIGTQDPMVPHEGGLSVSPWGESPDMPPVKASVARWAEMTGCPAVPQTVQDADGVHILRYGPGNDCSETLFYTVEGMGHIWPGGTEGLPEAIVGPMTDRIVANDVMWDFLNKHPLH